jgi:hypothetical protein
MRDCEALSGIAGERLVDEVAVHRGEARIQRRHGAAGLRIAGDGGNLDGRMGGQQPQELCSGEPRRPDDADLGHGR